MPQDRFFIAPYNNDSGLQADVKPWLLPEQAFAELTNAYVFRGRVRKRFGSRWLGNTQFETRFRINLGNTAAGAFVGNVRTIAADAGMPTSIGQAFSIGNIIFTVFNPAAGAQIMYRSDGGAASTYNLGTSAVNIAGVGNGIAVYFYPGFPVMGLRTFEQDAISEEKIIGFDTRFAYEYNAGWERLAGESLAGASVWTGSNSQFFWTTTWSGANASDKVFFVTNDNNEIRYFLITTNQWNFANFYYTVDSLGVSTNGAGAAAGIVPAASGEIGQVFIIGNTAFRVIVANGALDPISIVETAAPIGTGTFNTATGAYTFLAATPNSPIFFSGTNEINSARIIVPFKNRLLLFNTIEGGTRYPNRCRFSQVGSPLGPVSWMQQIPGRGGGLDAPTVEAIVTVEFIRDRLIVFFENSTWELTYTGNQIYPFSWQQINTELGAESTFSIVPFDKVAIGVGNVGIHACNGINVERIDQKIPEAVFAIHNVDAGVNRVYGIRDYNVEMLYWAFPDVESDSTFPFPSRVLIYNYATGTWAINHDSITCFGYFQPTIGVLWSSTTVTWDDSTTWGSGFIQAQARQVIAGNQEGYTLIIDTGESTNASVLQITDISVATVGTFNTVTFTVVQHNVRAGEYLFFEGIVGGNLNTLNNVILNIVAITNANTFICTYEDGVTVLVGPYQGGGLISRVSNINIKTKEYNFYATSGRDAAVSRVNFLVDRTNSGQMTLNFYVNSDDYSNLSVDGGPTGTNCILGTNILETTPYATEPAEEFANRLWHPVHVNAEGNVIQFQLTMSDTQLKDVNVRESDFQLHAMLIIATPSRARLQ